MKYSAGRLIIHIPTKCRWRWPQMKLKSKSLLIGQCHMQNAWHNKKNPEYHVVAAIRQLRTDKLSRRKIMLTFNMVWPWFSCGTVCVCLQLPYRGNDMIFWIFPIVPCHAFCLWHWPIGEDLDLSSIWGHHRLSEYMDISQTADYFKACYTVLMRPNKVETAVHGCKCWLSVWTLSCRCPVKLFT